MIAIAMTPSGESQGERGGVMSGVVVSAGKRIEEGTVVGRPRYAAEQGIARAAERGGDDRGVAVGRRAGGDHHAVGAAARPGERERGDAGGDGEGNDGVGPA